MSFAKRIEALNTVRMRLTVIAAAVMMAVAGVTFLLFYSEVRNALAQRLDIELTSEWHEFRNIYADGGMPSLQKEFLFEQDVLGADGGFMRAYDNGELDVLSGDLAAWGPAAVPAIPAVSLIEGKAILDYAKGRSNEVRIRRLHGLIAPNVAVLMASSVESNFMVLAELRRRFALMFAAMVVPVLAGAWLVARQTMRGVGMVTRTAVQVASGHLDRRVAITGKGRELDELAAAFNTMVEHLLTVNREIKETNDNIAHDLRTPITRVRAASEALVVCGNGSDHAQKVAADIIAECDNLLSIVNTMLDISEMEAGVRKLTVERLDLGILVREARELFAPAMEERGIRLNATDDGPILLNGDRQLLRRAICNVLDNAVKFSPDGGEVTLSMTRANDAIELTVRDAGCGIPKQDLPRVFERFFRGDKARSLSGNGLGLGLVKAIATAHGGEVCVSSEPGAGTTVHIRLPIAADHLR